MHQEVDLSAEMYFETWSRMGSDMFQFPRRAFKAGKYPAVVHDLDTCFLEAERCLLEHPSQLGDFQGLCILLWVRLPGACGELCTHTHTHVSTQRCMHTHVHMHMRLHTHTCTQNHLGSEATMGAAKERPEGIGGNGNFSHVE